MEIPSEVITLGHFLMLTLIHFVPCLLGSAVSQFIKNAPPSTGKRKKKHKVSVILATTVVSAIFPTIIITIIHTLFADKGPDEVYLCIAVILGALGDDITRFFLSFKNTMILFKTVTKGMHEIKDITKLLEELEESREEDEEKKEDNDDKK